MVVCLEDGFGGVGGGRDDGGDGAEFKGHDGPVDFGEFGEGLVWAGAQAVEGAYQGKSGGN